MTDTEKGLRTELDRAGYSYRKEHGGKHPRLVVDVNGREEHVLFSESSSDFRGQRNERARMKRLIRQWKAEEADAVESLETDTAPASLPTTHQEEAAMSDSTDSEMVAVLGHDVRVVEYQGQRVVTLRQIDELHERAHGTARRQFNQNRKRYEDGRDVFVVPYETWSNEFRTTKFDGSHGGHRGDVILITERGYGKIVKGWNDDRSWALLDAMQDAYFALKGNPDLVRDGFDNELFDQIDERLSGMRSSIGDDHVATLTLVQEVFADITDKLRKLVEYQRDKMNGMEDRIVEAVHKKAWGASLHLKKALQSPEFFEAQGVRMEALPSPDTTFLTSYEVCAFIIAEDDIHPQLARRVTQKLVELAWDGHWPQGREARRSFGGHRARTFPQSRVNEWLADWGRDWINAQNTMLQRGSGNGQMNLRLA